MEALLIYRILILLLGSAEALTLTGTPCNTTLEATDVPQVLTSPGYPIKYKRFVTCWWKIATLNSSKVIVLETLDFKIEDSSSCISDYLELFDGSDGKATLIRKWCGTTRYFDVSSGAAMYFRFVTNGFYETRGFQFRFYHSGGTKPCDRQLVATRTEQTFVSPGYPLQYFNNMECAYKIQSESSSDRIQIDVATNMEDSSGCQNDFLTVTDPEAASPFIPTMARLCGTFSSTFQSASSQLTANFQSNGAKTYKGFMITYKSIPREDCTFHLRARDEEGFLFSPGYPVSYFSNLNCNWTIVAPSDRVVEIRMITSSVSGPFPDCDTDRVTVRADDGSVLGIFCASRRFDFNTNPGWKVVSFTTDYIGERSGFCFLYKLVSEGSQPTPQCGDTLSANSNAKTIQSLGYPVTPLEIFSCEWTITAVIPGEEIIVRFLDIDIEYTDDCIDKVTARSGPTLNAIINPLGVWCGQTKGEFHVKTTEKYLRITFTVDESTNGRGLSLEYYTSAVPAQDCYYKLVATDTVSYLRSPGYPDPFMYQQGRVCQYEIRAENSSQQIQFDVVSSDLLDERDGNLRCYDEYVKVYNGPSKTSFDLQSVTGRRSSWCGREEPLFISNGDTVLLEFHPTLNDEAPKRKGFLVSFVQNNFESMYISSCGGSSTATLSTQRFSYANNSLYSDKICTWTIHAENSNSKVRLKAYTHLRQRIGNECDGEYLIIYDGLPARKNLLTTMCGRMSQSSQSTGQILTFQLITDNPGALKNITIDYHQTEEEFTCDDLFHASAVASTTYSPGWPKQYIPNINCKWRFYVPRGFLKVDFVDADFSSKPDCEQRRAVVYNGPSNSYPVAGEYCGGTSLTFLTSHSEILVEFKSGSRPTGTGFSLSSKVVDDPCPQSALVVPREKIYITSPNYPFHYPMNISCTWQLAADDDSVLLLKFEDVGTADTVDCTSDYIDVFDGQNDTSKRLERLCRTGLREITSSGHVLFIRFITDDTKSSYGFKASCTSLPAKDTPLQVSSVVVGAIIGGIVALLLLIVIIVAVAVACQRKERSKPDPSDQPTMAYLSSLDEVTAYDHFADDANTLALHKSIRVHVMEESTTDDDFIIERKTRV